MNLGRAKTKSSTGRHAPRTVRCAIYTRVSTDAGLDQDFNSLDAQYDASQSYIRSQAHAGWTMVRTRYDDGGFSGGSTDRPALQKLLDDIRDGRIDVIVVYKIDRLTRSLADFAKLVELFDEHGVTFVSVTQQFNTTTSMGRLTLNVLLSFAQFEREVTAERIRDKVAASKRKGVWIGGMVPLGYEVRDGKPVIVEDEAKRVRTIFKTYLEVGSVGQLLPVLRKDGIVTKVRHLSTGKTIGGIPFSRGPLAHLLRNRFYIGEVSYKGEVCPGEQPPILDRELFDAVQVRLDQQRVSQDNARVRSDALLIGRIHDDAGNAMTPTHAQRRNVRYRYYVSTALVQGQSDEAGSVARVPAAEVEAVIIKGVRERLGDTAPADDRALIDSHVVRIDVQPASLVVALRLEDGDNGDQGELSVRPSGDWGDGGVNSDVSDPNPDLFDTPPPDNEALGYETSGYDVLHIPWTKPPTTRLRHIVSPQGAPDEIIIPSPTRLVASIAKGRVWLSELVTGQVLSIEEIAAREGCSVRHVNMTISLAFLAPDIVNDAIDGKLPRDIGIVRLSDPPAEWSKQCPPTTSTLR